MAALLVTNIFPLKKAHSSFAKCFDDLIQGSDYIKIAVGYISVESLMYLNRFIRANNKPYLEMMIGMHHFEGFTQPQYEATLELNKFLLSSSMGKICIATALKFHGKVYLFRRNKESHTAIVGSSNLDGILDRHRLLESNLLIKNRECVLSIDKYISDLFSKISKPLNNYLPKIIEKKLNFGGYEGVIEISENGYKEIKKSLSKEVFEIPLKCHGKSNLNVYFGKERENKQTGILKPRGWYEIEIIVPIEITQNRNYPKKGTVITVYTDDYWKFKCKISGDYNKNLRSYEDLKILGRWVKGRLENSGALKVGEKVTEEVLQKYGRKNISMKKTKNPKIWILEFNAKKKI